MRTCIVALGALILLGGAAPAEAQDVAAADALFRRGIEGMDAGRYVEGCAALAESNRLEPRTGTLFALAECRAKEGKIATAVALYEDYLTAFARLPPAQQAAQRAREKAALDKRRELGPRVPRLVLRLPSGVSASVTRDDVALHAPALGIPLPVDPGEHEVTTQVDSGTPHRQTVTIGLDEEKVVDLEVMSAPPPPAAPEVRPPQPHVVDPPSPPASRSPIVYVVAGVGVVGLALGATTGAMVLGKKGVVAASCVEHICDREGLDAARSAGTLGAISTAGFIAGGVALAAAGVLFLTDRPASTPARAATSRRQVVGRVDSSGAWLGVSGEW